MFGVPEPQKFSFGGFRVGSFGPFSKTLSETCPLGSWRCKAEPKSQRPVALHEGVQGLQVPDVERGRRPIAVAGAVDPVPHSGLGRAFKVLGCFQFNLKQKQNEITESFRREVTPNAALG